MLVIKGGGYGIIGIIGGSCCGIILSKCAEKDPPSPPDWPFWFKAFSHCHDIPSCRRGYEVYRQVCATCHAAKFVCFRHMVNTIYPENRVKQIAASFDYEDGPNDKGEMFTRPGNLLDPFPSPYPNEEAARFANQGASPPDLSQQAAAHHGGCDYIMSLLTGYRDPPAGVNLRSGLYYNTYFPGGAISMPPPLNDGAIEYEDGTPAVASQMAKDVTQFLTWAQDPQHDERKLIGLKMSTAALVWLFSISVWNRHVWTMIKTRRIDFTKTVY